MKASVHGPIHSATIICSNLLESIKAYTRFFGLETKDQGNIDADWAKHWQTPWLEGLAYACLGHPDESNWWLRFIERNDCAYPSPLTTHGWAALEINVQDVDALAQTLPNDYFTVIGQPANLAINENIRAMQVVGAAGEVLYLTTIKAPCPPFALPACDRWIDRIFIGVLSTHDRLSSQLCYQELFETEALTTETKISVLNNTFSKRADFQYPIALLQLAGQNLIEIDEVIDAKPRGGPARQMHLGITLVTFRKKEQSETPIFFFGPDGEGVEIISTTQ